MRRLISSGSTFEAEIGYSRAVVDGDWVFVSGTTGFDYSRMTIEPGIVEQTEQCMRNIEAALREAGSTIADVVRVIYVVPVAAEFEPAEWSKKDFTERVRVGTNLYVLEGLGYPLPVYLFHAVKLVLFVLGWMFFCSFTRPFPAG